MRTRVCVYASVWYHHHRDTGFHCTYGRCTFSPPPCVIIVLGVCAHSLTPNHLEQSIRCGVGVCVSARFRRAYSAAIPCNIRTYWMRTNYDACGMRFVTRITIAKTIHAHSARGDPLAHEPQTARSLTVVLSLAFGSEALAEHACPYRVHVVE